jgi:hypothetical protein
MKKIISWIKKKWQEEDTIIKNTIYIMIILTIIMIIFFKQVNNVIELISLKFSVPINNNQILSVDAQKIFLLSVIIFSGILSSIIELIKKLIK